MLIGAISSASSSPIVLNPATVNRSKAASATTAGSAASTTSAASSTSSASTITPASSGGDYSSGGASAGSSAAVETLVTSYSTTVGGTQYSGSVEESDGEFVASVPTLSGATATGSSEIAAENNLDVRIDELV